MNIFVGVSVEVWEGNERGGNEREGNERERNELQGIR